MNISKFISRIGRVTLFFVSFTCLAPISFVKAQVDGGTEIKKVESDLSTSISLLLSDKWCFTAKFRDESYLVSSDKSSPVDAFGNRFQKVVYEGEFKWSGDCFALRYSIISRDPGNETTDHSETLLYFDGKRYYWGTLPPGQPMVVHTSRNIDVFPAGLSEVFSGVPPFSSLQYLMPYADLSVTGTNLEKIKETFIPNLIKSVFKVESVAGRMLSIAFGANENDKRIARFDLVKSPFPIAVRVDNPTYPPRKDIPYGEMEVTKFINATIGSATISVPSEVQWTFYNKDGQRMEGYAQSKSSLTELTVAGATNLKETDFRPPLPDGATMYDKDINKWFAIGENGKAK